MALQSGPSTKKYEENFCFSDKMYETFNIF